MKKVLIYGYSEATKEIIKILKDRDYKLFVTESKIELVNEIKQDGYDGCLIHFNNDDDLKSVGIGKDIDVLFCMSSDHNANLFVTLSARNLDKKLTIISLASKKSEEQKILLAGANKVINSYEIGAHHIFRMIKKPTVFKTLDKIFLSFDSIKIAQIEILKNSFLDGVKFKDIDIEKKFNIIVIGVENIRKKGKFIFNTKKINQKVDSNHILVVMGEAKNIEKLKKELRK